MAAITFPSSPADGDIYNFGGTEYAYEMACLLYTSPSPRDS